VRKLNPANRSVSLSITKRTVTVTELYCAPTRRPRVHHRVNPGARIQNETEMFSDHDETSPSIAAVSGANDADQTELS